MTARYVVQAYGKKFRVWDCRALKQIGKFFATEKSAKSKANALNEAERTSGR